MLVEERKGRSQTHVLSGWGLTVSMRFMSSGFPVHCCAQAWQNEGSARTWVIYISMHMLRWICGVTVKAELQCICQRGMLEGV